MHISIDFDQCLTKPSVQKLAKELIRNGHKVFILTSRFDSIRRLKFPDRKSNEDLYRVAEEVGIKPYHIAFTNQQKKWIWLLDTDIKIHIDDDKTVLRDLGYYGYVQGFDCEREDLEEAVLGCIRDLENF